MIAVSTVTRVRALYSVDRRVAVTPFRYPRRRGVPTSQK